MSWQTDLLHALGAPPTAENLRFVNAWRQAEGGAARFNPFNTTQRAPGATSYNSVGVRNYPTYQAGIHATVQTLMNGRYQPIVSLLRSGRASAVDEARAVANSPWGTGGGVLRVLGAGGASGAPLPGAGQPASPTAAPQAAAPPGVDTHALRATALQALLGQVGAKTPDYTQFLGAAKQLRAAQPAPQLGVQVEHNEGVPPGAIGAVRLAKRYLGTDYHWGGASPKTGFDCSGLLQWAYAQKGIRIPRTSQQQFKAGIPVARGHLEVGDAVFFVGSDGTRTSPGHVGIYVGGGQFIQSPHTGDVVKISKLADYQGSYVGARRYS